MASIDKKILKLIRSSINSKFSALHPPILNGDEKKILSDCIDTTYVSSVGKFVDKFENKICKLTKSKYAVAVVNGTSAIHLSLEALNINFNHEVLVPSLTFVGTGNAIMYSGASPHFVDCELDNFLIDLDKLEYYLDRQTFILNSKCYNKNTKKQIKAIIPVHLFGHPLNMKRLIKIAKKFHLIVIEDSAEAIGTFYDKKHVGTFGKIGILSFNGNKTITTGGGGIILTNNYKLALKIKHLSTTAKIKHDWKSEHDLIGYNYRMPNINAALGLSQLKKLNKIILNKRKLYKRYRDSFKSIPFIKLIAEPKLAKSNYWLQTIFLKDISVKEVEQILNFTNKNKIATRSIWSPLHKMKMYKRFPQMNLENTNKVYKRIINLPSNNIVD